MSGKLMSTMPSTDIPNHSDHSPCPHLSCSRRSLHLFSFHYKADYFRSGQNSHNDKIETIFVTFIRNIVQTIQK